MELREVPRRPRWRSDRPLLPDGAARGSRGRRLHRESARGLNDSEDHWPEDHWFDWHRGYDIPGSRLQQRLAIVQGRIRDALDRCAPGRIRVVSMCAGQGHDLVGALEDHPRAPDVQARLVEFDPRNCEAARASAPPGVEVVEGDASLMSAYAGAIPAEIVLACGVFGNISDADIVRTIEMLPSLCAPGATVVWTRHRREPDLTPDIRKWFQAGGFTEVSFDGPDGFIFGVGVNQLAKPPAPFRPDEQMFEFVGSDQNWENNQPA